MSEHLSIPRMNDLLDGQLPSAEAEGAREHLEACGACRQEFALLSETVGALRQLPRAARPSEGVWSGIEARIAGTRPGADDPPATVLPFPGPGADADLRGGRGKVTLSVRQLAAAAAVVALLSAGVVWTALGGGSVGSPAPSATGPGVAPGAAARAVSVSGAAYDQAVTELEALVEQGRAVLAPETVASLEESLATIDRALADVRGALAEDPSSDLLQRMLVSHQTARLRVLRQAATSIQSRS